MNKEDPMKQKSVFTEFSSVVSRKSGHPVTFLCAVFVIFMWAIAGPLYHFSDTWQLVINTATTIVTFLMVFLIQNTQNRDNHAVQLKLDELIRAVRGAHNSLVGIEQMTDDELQEIKKKYLQLAQEAMEAVRIGKTDTDRPEIK
jgi:low affinity Fe/Cu permease